MGMFISMSIFAASLGVDNIHEGRIKNKIILFSHRAMLAGHFFHSWAFQIILHWLPSYFHDISKTAKVTCRVVR